MFRNRFALVLTLLLTSPLVGACSASGDGTTGPGVPNGARLEIVGAALRSINEFSEEEIEVRYVSNAGEPLNGVVDFAIEGSAGGATLSGRAAPTNDAGHARVTLRAGDTANFDVVAVAPNAAPATITVQVQEMRFGALNYMVTYAGRRAVDTVETALFTNVSCTELSRAVPSPREVQYTRLRATEAFEGVEVGVPLAVYALGIDRTDNVAAEACADVTLTETDETIEIPLDDLAELFGGEYNITETFDVTEGFNPTLDLLLEIMSGLATDPAAFVVDFVATHPDTPSWLRTALGSRVTRDLVADTLRSAISDIHVPGYLVEVAEFGHGMNTAFENLTFDGRLSFEEADEFGMFVGTHRITRMTFPLTDGLIAERVLGDAIADVNVTVGPTITLDEHSFNIAFGEVVEMILRDVLLPRVPGSPASVGHLLGDLLDCGAISGRLGGSSTTRSITEGVCDIGLALLGGLIEGYITELWQYDTLYLSGTANLVDSDGDYDRDRLEEGSADARWVGSSGELLFNGEFAGTRLDDEPGRVHPVRERMTGLR